MKVNDDGAVASGVGKVQCWCMAPAVSRHWARFILVVCGLVLGAGAARAFTFYVSPSGSHVFPFASWATAATNLATAAAVARDGDIILVGDGVYVLAQQVLIDNAVMVRGANGAAATVVDGNHAGRCFYLDHPGAVLEGLTIQRGKSDEGGGVYLHEGGTVRNCLIVSNQAPSGGGVFCYYGGLVQDSVLVHNLAMTTNVNPAGNFFYGGAVNCHNGGTVQNCMIVSNAATHEFSPTGVTYYCYGGGVYSWHAGVIQNCWIDGNRAVANNAAAGGGVNLHEGSDLRNCVIVNNRAVAAGSAYPTGEGGGLYMNLEGWGGSVESCTIARNTALGEYSGAGGGIFNFRCPNRVRNTIVHYNAAVNGANIYNDDESARYDYCCTVPARPGTGNITGDPLFVSLVGNDYRLRTLSPCIDAGDAATPPAFDYEFNDRPLDGNGDGTARTDIGAYEYTTNRLTAPAGVTATDGTHYGWVAVAWSAVSGAAGYDVWRGTNDNCLTAERIAENVTATYYNDASAVVDQVYYYWVKVKTSAFSAGDGGYAPALGPAIRANGARRAVTISVGMPVTVDVSLIAGPYVGALADCWIVAVPHTGAWWYFLDAARVWTPFAAGSLGACTPVYAGPVGDVAATTVLDHYMPARGVYDFYFALDALDGVLDPNTPFRDVVRVSVE